MVGILKSKILKNKVMIKISICILMFLLVCLGIIYATNINKGELNGDKLIDYVDVNLLQNHLISLIPLPAETLDNADMNDDGKITVTDLSLLIKKIENERQYSVELENLDTENYYPEKNKEIELQFNAIINYDDVTIQKVIINNKEYVVDNAEGIYKVKINVGENAGKQEYHVSKVILSSGAQVKVDKDIAVCVLKAKPYVDDSSYKLEETFEGKAYVSFDLIDEENCLTSGEFSVYEVVEENSDPNVSQENKLITTANINAGANRQEIVVEDGKHYFVQIVIGYNSVIEQIPGKDHVDKSILYNKDFIMSLDYKLSISNIKTLKDGQESNKFARKEPIKIAFDSTNVAFENTSSSNFEPSTITVNQKEYEVTKEEKYTATIDGIDQVGQNTITIEKIKLKNGKEITLQENNTVTVIIDSKKPVVMNLETQENVIDKNVKVKFEIQDEEKNIQSAKVVLYDSGENIIESKDITVEELAQQNIEKIFSTNNINTDKYIVRVIATYREDENNIITDSILLEKEIAAEVFATIKKATLSSKNVEKNESVKVTYEIETNSTSEIEKIRVNNLDCIATKISNTVYEIVTQVGAEAKVLPLVTTKLKFKDEKEATVDNTISVTVLKDIPSTGEIKQEDNLSENKVTITFSLIDNDKSFISGKVKLIVPGSNGTPDQVIQEPTIQMEGNRGKVVFENLEVNKEYVAKLIASYNRYPEGNDNIEVDKVIAQADVMLVGNYNLEISDVKTVNQEKDTKYFNKNEEIGLSFTCTNATSFIPQKAVISGNEYTLTRNGETNTYTTKLPSFETSGVKEYNLETIVLSNNRYLDVPNEQKIKLEVLKDKATITSFRFKEDEADKNKIIATFNLNDAEATITNGSVIITDDHKREIKTQNLVANSNEIIFEKTNSEYYNIKVIVNYDLDTNALGTGDNEYQDQILLHDEIDFTERKIQLKDITDVQLYHNYHGYPMEVSNIDSNEIISNPENYVAKVKMKNMPDMFANVKACRIEQRKVLLELDVENTIVYEGDEKQTKVEVPFGVMGNTGSSVSNESFERLLARMREYPNATFNLTKDYDASECTVETLSYYGEMMFEGTINGNGHTIYNLQKPLFNEIERATIKNLIIENAYITTQVGALTKGIIANEAYNKTTFSNVHIKNSTFSTYGLFYGFGSFVGRLSGSRIEKCSATNITMTAPEGNKSRRVGGLVGEIGYASTIEDCYVKGNVEGSWEVGGIVGGVQDGMYQQNTIKHCISKVNISGTSGPGNVGGIVGNPNGSARVKLIQNISLADGSKANKVHGNSVTLDPDTFNYEMTESSLNSNAITSNGLIKEVSKNEFNGEFCKEQLGFNDQIWNLENKNYENLPTLKGFDPNNKIESSSSGNYIPDIDRLKKMEDYDPKKETAYSNLYKLMPFFDSKYLVVDGGRISEDDVLNQKQIKSILPFNAQNKYLITLTEENYNTIDHINVVFEDDTTKQYKLNFKNMYNHIVAYKFEGLGIEYNFNKYVIKQDAEIVQKLVKYLQSLNFNSDLKPLVGEISLGSRIYVDFFNETIKSEEYATQFVLNFIGNMDGYSVTFDNDILNGYIYAYLTNNTVKFKQAIFTYMYLTRFYGFEVSDTRVSDIILFKGDVYSNSASTNNLISQCMKSNSLATHVNQRYYRENLGPCVGISTIAEFVEYNIKIFANNQDPNDWFVENFSGIIAEAPAKGYEDSVDYRAWKQLKKQEKFILPMLTLPENSGYMISAPTTFLIGSQRLYVTDPGNEKQIANLERSVQNFAKQIGVFYTTTAGFVEASVLNQVCDIAIDTTVLPVLGEQKNGKATDKFCKNMNELLYEWFTIRAVAAYSGGQRIFYVVDSILGTYTRVWSHETGHNQCNWVFFKRNGFRPVGGFGNTDGSGTEDYTDGNTTQGFGDGEVNFNLSFNYTDDKVITSNLTTERINTTEKLESYYKGMFEAIDFLDYAEAKAFLKLTPEEQSKVAVQIYYPNAPGNYANVGWKPITKEEFEQMNLKTVEDIYDNQITIKPGITAPVVQTGEKGLYGSENMYIRRWYQPYNEKGRTHSYGFTYTAWQMLGIGGYDGGYITYFSGKSKNDLDAIKKVTKDPDMTWKKFKTGRYDLMENSWNTMSYFDSNDLVEKYVDALKLDAANNDRNVTNSTNVRRVNYHYLKRVTDDFRGEVLNGNIEKIHITSAKEFKEKITKNLKGYFVLDNDIDLSTVTGENAIIDGYFMGKLDGQGHKLIGNTIPIFDSVKFAHISNLEIENSNITSSAMNVGSLAKAIGYSQIENITAKNINVSATNKQVGGIVGNMVFSFAKNIHVMQSQVLGTTRVGNFAGYVGQSQVEQSTVNGMAKSTGNACGGFIGEIYSKASVNNCYSIGEAQGNQDIGGFIGYVNTSFVTNCFSNTKAKGNAGIASFTGQTTGNSIIKNNITLVNQITGYKFDGRTSNTNFKNFSGNYENKANVGLSTLTRTGVDFTGKIDVVEGSELTKESFYTETLTWDNKIWDFAEVQSGKLPKLRNDDPNGNITNIEKYNITNAQEFETLINEHKEATFVLKEDIDLSTLNSTTTIIDGVFMGTIEGNNHTISGNKVPIFNTTRYAQIYDLKIEGSNIVKNEVDVGALAKIAYYMELKNVVAKGINISNKNREVGGLVGIMTNSNLEDVHIIDSEVSGTNRVGLLIGYIGASNIKSCSANGKVISTGNNSGGFIGEAINATNIENCYSLGRVEGVENVGGFIGVLNKSSVINSMSAVRVDGNEGSSGFISQSLTNSTVKNNIALGNQTSLHYKFDGKTVNEQLSNYSGNYEYADNVGISTLIREGIDFEGKIDIAFKEDITNTEFYTDTLEWDQNIWDLSKISEEKLPKLRNSDPNVMEDIKLPKHSIHSAEEFESLLNQYPDEEFIIENDIDLSTLNTTGSTIITKEFFGSIEGKNHIISGNKKPIFNKATYSKIYNLKLEGTEIVTTEDNVGSMAKIMNTVELENIVLKNMKISSTKSNVGGLSGTLTHAKLNNVHITNTDVSGVNRVASIAGYADSSSIKASSASASILASGNNCSALIGEATNKTNIENCYSVGSAVGNQDIGGLVGVLNDSTITNSFSAVKVSGKLGVAGLIGKSQNNAIVKNNIALGDQQYQYKFDGRTANDQFVGFENNYEYEENDGISTLTREGIDFTGKIGVSTKVNITSQDFYTNTLGWSSDIWDLSKVAEEKLPKLKNSDPNEYIGLETVEQYSINSADEFVNLMKAHPYAIFNIESDIDFAGKQYSIGSILISGTFTGEIKGNNHTIKNLYDATLFEKFQGKVDGLNMENYCFGVKWKANGDPDLPMSNSMRSAVAAFARQTSNATFTNMKFNKMTLLGNAGIATISVQDENSTFENIVIENIYLYSRYYGNRMASMVSTKNGGSIKNCYLQGELHAKGSNNAGVVAILSGDAVMENVISNIYMECEVDQNNPDNAKTWGGFIANAQEGNIVVKNSAVISKHTDAKNPVNKFTALTDTDRVSQIFQNCYENGSSQGTSNSNSENIKIATNEQLLTKQFYTNSLHLDENVWDLENIQQKDIQNIDKKVVNFITLGLKNK